MLKPKLQVFADSFVVEALLSDRFVKQAQDGFVSGLVDSVKSYAGSHIDQNNKVGSILELLTPGILTAFGFSWLAILYELASSIFGINLSSIFATIKQGVSSLIGGGKQTDTSSITSLVTSAFSSVLGLETKSSMNLEEARLFKTSMDNFVSAHSDFSTSKTRVQVKLAAGLFGLTKQKTGSALVKVVIWIITVLLASAGFMVAGDAIHGLVGTVTSPTAPQTPGTPGTPNANPSTTEQSAVTLQVNPGYSEENYNSDLSSWTIPGSVSSIGDTLVNWAVDIYPQLKGYESTIRSTSGLSQVTSAIQAYNQGNSLGFISMPKQFKSRKQVVDLFVGEIQKKLNEMQKPTK